MLQNRACRGAVKASGFTLVELLVVITIIGLLVGMLLPAVNAARESGRNAQCKNNLKQLGLACFAHEEAQGIFPTGGWGWHWVGDPDQGYGSQQPGGWIYNILPHTEYGALHDLGKANTTTVATILKLIGTPLPFANCPTRRRAVTFPNNSSVLALNISTAAPPAGTMCARTDYACNVGDFPFDEYGQGPTNATKAAQDAYFKDANHRKSPAPYASYTPPQGEPDMPMTRCRGIIYEQSTTRKDDVRDGISNTLLAGEKWLGSDRYDTAGLGADNENMYTGMDNDVCRTTSEAPKMDQWTPGVTDTFGFGSAHPNAANFVLCDGATISINYSVDKETFRRLGTRADGMMLDTSKLQ